MSSRKPRSTREQTESRDSKILAWIRRYICKHGVSPTYREIASHFGMWPRTVTDCVTRLSKQGAIEREESVSRGIRMPANPGRCRCCGKKL